MNVITQPSVILVPSLWVANELTFYFFSLAVGNFDIRDRMYFGLLQITSDCLKALYIRITCKFKTDLILEGLCHFSG